MITKELCVVASKYTGRDGQEKTRWLKIGHIHKTQDGSRHYITLDPLVNLAAVPRREGDDRVYVNMFDPKPRDGQQQYQQQQQPQQQQQQQQPQQQAAPEFADDIPF